MDEHELLITMRPRLRRLATRLASTNRGRIVEDLAQEGWIAIWREVNRGGCSDVAWLTTVATNRMRDVLKATRTVGRDEGRQLLVDDIASVWEGATLLHDIETAYHHGEIARALANLTLDQRIYVELRFFRGWQKAELDGHFGCNANNIWNQARRKLVKELAHLAPASYHPKVDGRTLRGKKATVSA